MAELIDRQALLNKLKAYKHGDIYDAFDMILLAPTVDAVEVVRCKDCIRWKCYGKSEPHMGDCLNMQKWDGIYKTMFDCDFCSEGERRENE